MTIYSGFYPLNMVIFHSLLYVYQRVANEKYDVAVSGKLSGK